MSKNKDRNESERNMNDTDDIETGEVVGTLGGGTAGAVIGSVLGPLGTVAGGVIGAALGNKAGEPIEEDEDPNKAE